MSQCESVFIEAWRAGVQLTVNGNKIHLKAPVKPPEELLRELEEHKPELLRFLSCWIDTPYGQAKFWGFLNEERCGVVLRNRPDRVTWVKRSELMIKPDLEDKSAAVQ